MSFFYDAARRSEMDMLKCPGCDNEYLHQNIVNVFCRDEDKDVMLVTVDNISGDIQTTKNAHPKNNPSPRRQALSILFKCELCNHAPVLTILQHKGGTYIHWGVQNATNPTR